VTAQPVPSPIDRIPPNNLEAEMALLGSVLVDREMLAAVGELVRPADFYAHVHETIFGVLVDLYERGEPLDKISVAEELRRRGVLERVGGLPYLTALMDTVQTAASARYYATIVREKSVLRSLIHAGTEITQLGYEGEEDVASALDKSEQLVYTIGERRGVTEFMPVNRLMKDAFDHIDRLFHMRGDRTGLTAGFHDIDAMTTGFQPGNFIIIAARPGMGKSSFALNMAVAAAREAGEPIAFFSLEMSNNELIQRLICAEARISMNDMRRGNIKQHQWEDISRAMGTLNDLPIYLDDLGALTIADVRSRCRRLRSTAGLAAIFIDYLQLVRPSVLSRNANRNEELSEICRSLKMTAKDLSVPIVALAQLNRGVEIRSEKRPMLADLRDCLAGAALVTNANTGQRIRMSEIVEKRLRFNVWAMDERLKLVQRPIVDAWEVGPRAMCRVMTRSGRTIRCTEGHRFFTPFGWSELRALKPGDSIAAPRRYAAPAWGSGSIAEGRALLLGWLLGDGHLGGGAALTVTGPAEAELAVQLARDEFGLEVNAHVHDLRVAHRRSHAAFGWRDPGKRMSRSACGMLAGRLQDDQLEVLAQSDVVWETVTSIEPCGVETAYDLTVGNLHNFCADDLVTHNSGSLEQEADVVAFLYRDGYYNPETPEPDATEFIIAKHRNGPTGTVKLRFQREYTLFLPYGDESHFPPP
jgi:replicative DNA helicase